MMLSPQSVPNFSSYFPRSIATESVTRQVCFDFGPIGNGKTNAKGPAREERIYSLFTRKMVVDSIKFSSGGYE